MAGRGGHPLGAQPALNQNQQPHHAPPVTHQQATYSQGYHDGQSQSFTPGFNPGFNPGTVAMVVAIKPVVSSMAILVAEDTMRTMEVLVAVAGGGEAVEVSVVAMAATATATTTLLASAVAGAIKEASTRTRLHQWALAMLVLATLLGTGLHQPNPSKFNMRRRARLICS